MKSAKPLLLMFLLLFSPIAAVGQCAGRTPQIASLDPTTAWPKSMWRATRPLASEVRSAEASPASREVSCSVRPLATLMNREPKEQLRPYILAGMVLGGVAGYLYRDSFDPEYKEEDWGVGYIVFPFIGVGIGFLVGGLVGLSIEG